VIPPSLYLVTGGRRRKHMYGNEKSLRDNAESPVLVQMDEDAYLICYKEDVPKHSSNHWLTTILQQASLTAKATPAKSSTAPASSSATGVKNLKNAPYYSTTSRPSSKYGACIGYGGRAFNSGENGPGIYLG
jgi:hypothetical protein